MNRLYPTTIDLMRNGYLPWQYQDARMLFVSGEYYFSEEHEFLEDIPVLARLADQDIAGERVSGDAAQGDTTTFSAVVSTTPVEAIVIYIKQGGDSTSRLVAFYDTVDGLPLVLDGQDYFVSMDHVFGGFFKLQ